MAWWQTWGPKKIVLGGHGVGHGGRQGGRQGGQHGDWSQMLDNWAQTFSTRRFNTRLACLLKLCEFIGEATNGPLYIIDFLLRKTKDRRTFLFTLPKIYFHKFTKKQFKKFPKMYFHKFTNLPKSLGPRCLQSERGRNIWGVCILFQNKANTWNLLFQNSSNVEIFPFQNTSRILFSNTKYSSWWNLMLTAQIHIYVLRCSNTSYI